MYVQHAFTASLSTVIRPSLKRFTVQAASPFYGERYRKVHIGGKCVLRLMRVPTLTTGLAIQRNRDRFNCRQSGTAATDHR
jgi:hypothetical protein